MNIMSELAQVFVGCSVARFTIDITALLSKYVTIRDGLLFLDLAPGYGELSF